MLTVLLDRGALNRSTSSTNSTTADALQAALNFADLGYPVLPVHGIVNGRCTCGDDCSKPGKHPHADYAPHGKDDATVSAKMIKHWFDRCPTLNYGVCTDSLPVVDIDPRNGGDKAWRQLLGTKHALPHTWTVATGGGGQHLLFSAPERSVPTGKLTRGVDLKAAGGYIVGVGSLHISGERYRWFADCGWEETELCPLPQWIADVIQEIKKPTKVGNWPPRDAAYFEELVAPAANGERHARVAQLLGHLFGAQYPNRGVLLQLVISHVHATYPDLTGFSDDEIVRMAMDFARRDDQKRGTP